MSKCEELLSIPFQEATANWDLITMQWHLFINTPLSYGKSNYTSVFWVLASTSRQMVSAGEWGGVQILSNFINRTKESNRDFRSKISLGFLNHCKYSSRLSHLWTDCTSALLPRFHFLTVKGRYPYTPQHQEAELFISSIARDFSEIVHREEIKIISESLGFTFQWQVWFGLVFFSIRVLYRIRFSRSD